MRRVVGLIVLFGTAACGGSLPEVPAGHSVSYQEHVEPLILKRCLGCHTREQPKGELVLEQGEGYSQLVDRTSVQLPQTQLVVAGDPPTSYLWQKLVGPPEKGQQMPRTLFGSKQLPEPELELIRRWIADGAHP
jgi:hypothetical protein